ncbi:HEAT repeat domain-containing protein [Kitasatospora sp. NPDC090091]|uniref:HEAT repeat domain-containing protein n=1 Tax=Kitasatospora sp. NPDC090091 TaxID=3364081 RepID=UPI00381E54EB
MWEGLEAVDWATLTHNYGSAEDVPALLRRCAGQDPEDAARAVSELLNHLFHQGGWICSAASATLPFLVRLAANPNVLLSSRRVALELVSSLAEEAGQVAEGFLDLDWRPAWERVLPEVLVLLTDPAPEVRRDAAHILGVCDSHGEVVLSALVRCWQAEADPATRLDLVLALGRAAGREPAGPQGAEVLELLRELLDAPEVQIRLAAVHALAPADPNLPVRRIDLLLQTVRDPSVELWRHTSSVDTGVTGVHHWTAKLFTEPSPAFTRGLLQDHPDVDQRVGALGQTGGLLAQWRSTSTELLPALRARLNDPAPEVRFRAAELLACLGPVGTAHADDVAALIGDTAARATRKRETVNEAALWALARMNDPRCIPALIKVMAEPRSGFATGSVCYPATAGWHYPVLPALHEVLDHLPDHAALLLPAVREQLDTATDHHVLNRLCQVLAGWGTAAKAAVPQLLGLLEDDRTWTAAARALAGIGIAGNGARGLLLARSSSGEAHAELAAWAYWKVGGEPGPALEALGSVAADVSIPLPTLRMIADLGPHAGRYVHHLRALTADTEPWTRIEAAHALWATTGDTETSVPALTTALQGLAKGTHLPVMLPTVRYLARTGHTDQPTIQLLRGVLFSDQRLCSNGGWQGFTQDEAIRAAIEELLAASD